MPSYNIYVRDQRGQGTNTQVDMDTISNSNTTMPPSLQGQSLRATASLLAVANTAQGVGKTFIDLKVSRQGANAGKRLNAVYTLGSYAAALVANPFVGAAYILGDTVNRHMRINEERRIQTINEDYVIDKLNLTNSRNSRYRGGLT